MAGHPGAPADPQRPRLDPAALRAQLSRLRAVPTLPPMLERAVAALEDPEVNFENVAQLIEVDQALTAQVLRIANSAFYGPSAVSRVTQALVLLGSMVTRSVVLAAAIFDAARAGAIRGFWEHSLGCAVAAGAIAKTIGRCQPEEVSAAGLLHDIGKVALFRELPDVFAQVVERARADGGSFRDAEHALLGTDHCDIAGAFIGKWSFPASLAEPITLHHRPGRARMARDETAIVHVADVLVRALDFGWAGDERVGTIDPGAWAQLQLTPSILDDVLDRFQSDLEHALNYAVFE